MMRPLFTKQIRKSWKTVSLGGRLSEILIANGATEEQIVVVPNGVDDFWFDTPKSARKTKEIRFLMVGRNDPAKGYEVLKDALPLIHDPMEIHFVGDWPEIESRRHKLVYHGAIRDENQLMSIMDACDFLLLPSLSEGMPTVVLEAKARGLQVIATDVGAMKELDTELMLPGDEKELAQRMSSVNRLSDISGLPNKFRWVEIAKDTLEKLA